MSETDMRKRIVKVLKRFHPVAVENPACPGTPDVNYVEGWIELKHVPNWPKRGGILKIKHFTPQQRIWLMQRVARGGRVHLLLQVGQDWLLFSAMNAVKYLNNTTKGELIAKAQKVWHKGLLEKELIEELFNDY